MIVFNLGLCYHFGRGVPQDLLVAAALYDEFLSRRPGPRRHAREGGAAEAEEEGEEGEGDPVAGCRPWAELVEQLRMHCAMTSEKQGRFIATAAAILEG